MRFNLSFVAVVCIPFAAACSSGPIPSGGTSTAGTSGGSVSGGSPGGSSSGASTTGGTGTSGGSGTGTTSGGTGTTGGSTLSLPAGDCFTFATEADQQYSTACGDLMALEGANVDLSSGAGSSQLCLLSGTYTSLNAVPSSYAACAWTNYVEGAGGLANQGLIVLDSTATHHYRVWIESNTLPDLIFAFAQID